MSIITNIIKTEFRSEFFIQENLIAFLSNNEWETNFFNRMQGAITLSPSVLLELSPNDQEKVISEIVNYAESIGYILLEIRVDVKFFSIVPTIENQGFRFVDSHMRFLSLLEKKNFTLHLPKVGTIRRATKNDFSDIKQLTIDGFIKNNSFYSRYKNQYYYSLKESENYFVAYTTKYINESNSYFVVLEDSNKVVGYFIYAPGDPYKDTPLYKGILSSILPEYRGHNSQLAFQSYIYNLIPHHKWFVDNTTQITNYPVIKNHIRYQKNLQEIILIFYWKANKKA